MRITVQDVKAAGFCINLGARRWCAAHGVDFRKFVTLGIDDSELTDINDAMLERVKQEARKHG